ncbi:MAG: hypothetical protein Q8N89_05075 [Azonexus sp.]|nr:hypothetical protein [Azonexus sp.]
MYSPASNTGLDRRPVLLEMPFELGYADAIHSGRAFVLEHSIKATHQVPPDFQSPRTPLPFS